MLTKITLVFISSLSKGSTTDRTPLPESMLKFPRYLSGDTRNIHHAKHLVFFPQTFELTPKRLAPMIYLH